MYSFVRNAGISHSDVLAVWDELSYSRQQVVLKEYPGTERIAWNFCDAKRELALEIGQDFLSDLIIFGASALAETYVGKMYPPVHVYAMPAMVNSGARIAARISPKLAKIDYKLNNLYKKAEDFFKKKINTEVKKRTISTAQSKVDWHVKMVKSGKWKPCHGEWRGYYEGEIKGKLYRFKPTVEKHEYEVYRKWSGKGQHCGVFRTEGKRALEINEELAKWIFKGKW